MLVPLFDALAQGLTNHEGSDRDQAYEPEYVAEAFRAGASGYVLKRCAFSELMTAIRRVLSGHCYVTPMIAQHVVFTATNQTPLQSTRSLTLRQREVLQLVAEGCTAKEVANALNLSVKTAVFHKTAIMDKLGLRTTAELTRYALEYRIVIPVTRPGFPMPQAAK